MMNRFVSCCALLALLAVLHPGAAPEATAGAAPFSFDSVWFYRDGTRVVPEISRRWLTVAFHPDHPAGGEEADFTGGTDENDIPKKAEAIKKADKRIAGYLYDENLAENACFFRLRDGLKPDDIRQLVNLLNRDRAVSYVHPALVVRGKTYAYFTTFEMEWKTGIPATEKESLLAATHVKPAEEEGTANLYTVDVAAVPFFRALDLLAEDVRVLRATPTLLEIKPSITARLSLFMNGGTIGDSVPFTLTITFSDRVTVDPSSLATINLRPPEIQKELFDSTFEPYDYAKTVTRSPIVISGRLRFYSPGEFAIPPVKINYSCPSCPDGDNGVRSIETAPVAFRVASLIPTDRSENRLIVPTDPVPPDLHRDALQREAGSHLRLAIVFFALVVPCFAGLILVHRRASAERLQRTGQKMDVELAEQLRGRVQSAPETPHWRYLGEIGAQLRRYLLARYGIDGKYTGGSGTRFLETVAPHVPGECLDQLRTILAAIDTCVARETERYDDIDRLKVDLLHVIELTARNGAGRG